MSIPEHRRRLTGWTRRIVQLLNERTRHVLEIGVIKVKAGEAIYVPHRERMVLERVCKLNEGPMTDASLRAIYREVMSSALSLEKTMTIAYLGPEATFTHQAAIQKFGSSLRYAAQRTIADVFSEVSKNRADYGVVPVENSTEGVVTHTLDMFVESDLKIVAQIILPIRYCLAGRGGGEGRAAPLRPSAGAGPMPGLGAAQFAQQRKFWKRPPTPGPPNWRPKRTGHARGRARTAAITGMLAAEKYGLKSSSTTSRISRATPPGSWSWAGSAVPPAGTTAPA
jgi:chorismate mutase